MYFFKIPILIVNIFSLQVGDIRISFTYAGVSSGENLEFGQPDEVSSNMVLFEMVLKLDF